MKYYTEIASKLSLRENVAIFYTSVFHCRLSRRRFGGFLIDIKLFSIRINLISGNEIAVPVISEICVKNRTRNREAMLRVFSGIRVYKTEVG